MRSINITRNLIFQLVLVLLAIACFAYGLRPNANGVIRVIGYGGIAGIGFSILFKLALWRRRQEMDQQGNPALRYFGPRFSMPIFALFVGTVGVMELLNPINYRYSGNLIILAYTPLAIAVLILVLSIYYWTYRMTLKADVIERVIWPLPFSRYALNDLVSIEDNRPGNSVLKFSDGRQLVINGMLSGQTQFLDRLKSLTRK